MKKKLLLLIVLLIGISGCKREEIKPDPTPANIQKEVVLQEINHYVLDYEHMQYITDERMEAYQKAMDALYNHDERVKLTDSYDENLAVYSYIKENPYAFMVNKFSFSEDHTEMIFDYKYSKEECTEIFDFIDQEYLRIINENITPDMNEIEKILAIYHYFAFDISYDYEWVANMKQAYLEEYFNYPDIVVYDALKTHMGVCHTYTYLVQFAYQQLGINCVRTSSQMWTSEDYHMWPIIYIDDVPFHIDPTWDSNGDSVSLRYFGLTNEENYDRGIEAGWMIDIDTALSHDCNDSRFSSWRTIVDYELIGNHQMKAIREDGSIEIIDLTLY